MCFSNLRKSSYSHWKLYLLCIVFHLCIPFSGNAIPRRESKFLLIINSYNENAPWSQRFITPVLLQTS